MVPQPRILLVDGADLVRGTVAQALSEAGYCVIPAKSGSELIDKLPATSPDIVLLDLVLSDASGLSLITSIREHTDAPLLVISGKADMVDRIVGLEMGADDYIAKPIEIKELAARVRAHWRRYRALEEKKEITSTKRYDAERLKIGSWVLDRRQFQVFDEAGRSCDLTVKEFRLLEALAMEPGRVLSREQLLDKAHAGNYNVTDRAIDVQVARIRKKIGDCAAHPRIIKSVRSIGYMLLVEPEILQ